MDYGIIATIAGSVIALIAAIVKVHRDAIYGVVLPGFDRLVDATDRQTKEAKRRHRKAAKRMRRLEKSITKLFRCTCHENYAQKAPSRRPRASKRDNGQGNTP